MSAQLGTMFTYLDAEGVSGRTASAELVLGNSEIMTVRAGGPGVHSGPFCSPFTDYEVLLDHEPARFWTQYTDAVGMVYAHVPRLLLAHHVIRHGGISQMSTWSRPAAARAFVDMHVEVPRECEQMVFAMLGRIKDVHLVSTHLVAQ